MAILNYNNVQYDVVYIDPTLSESGDGTTPSTALITLPTLTDNTCYIIRRTSEEYLVDMPKTATSTSITHLLLLGMPTEDSDFYPLIPTEVKEAWGNDIDTYANVRMNVASYTTTTTNNIIFHNNTLISFICENCYFFRDGNGGSAQRYMSPMFWFDKSCDVIFNNCKFGYAQYDLDDDDYLANNEDIATDTSKYPHGKCCAYLYANTLSSLIFRNCTINHVRGHSYSDNNDSYYMHKSSFIVWNGCKNFIMDGCELNILNRHTYGTYSAQCTTSGMFINNNNQATNRNYSTIKDCTINNIFCNSVSNVGTLRTIRLDSNSVELENIKINFKAMKNFNVDALNLTDGTQVLYITAPRTNIKVNNIICDATQEGTPSFSGAPLLYLWTNYKPTGNPNSYIKNINFKFPSEPQKVISTSMNVLHLDSNVYSWNSSGEWTYSESGIYACTGRTYLADNIIVEAYKTTGNALYMNYANARGDHIYGDIYMSNSTLDVNTIKTYYSEGVGVSTQAATYLKCNEYIANMERYNGTAQISSTHAPSIYVNKTNALLFDEIVSTNNATININSMMICPNYIANGQLFARNTHTFAKSWSVTRTGSSASASIKFYNNTPSVSDPNPLTIGLEPFSGIEVLPTHLGKHTLTCYLATKNFSEDEKQYGSRHCWIDVIVPETTEDGVEIKHTYTSKSRPWYVDNSSWSGDAGLITYKIEMPIDIKDLTKPVNVKINYKWVSTSGFVYVDPDIQLVSNA